jgi:hypothetical protein
MTFVHLLNRGTHKLIRGESPRQRQVLTQHMTEPLTNERHLLIDVGVVGAILREMVELLVVLVHTAGTLLQVRNS